MDKTEFQREVDATVRELPLEPPEGTVQILTKRGFFREEVIVYKVEMALDQTTGKKRRMARLRCTACGTSSIAEYETLRAECRHPRHLRKYIVFRDPYNDRIKGTGDTCVCPSCGADVIAIHSSSIEGYHVLASCICVSVHNIRGHLCILSWRVVKCCDKNAHVSFVTNRYKGQIFINKKAVRVSSQRNNFGTRVYFTEWKSQKKFIDVLGSFSSCRILPFDENTVFETDLKNSAFEVYASRENTTKIFLSEYIRFYLKYPQVENLVRQGCSKLVDKIIENAVQYKYDGHSSFSLQKIKEYINHKAKKPHEILGIEKDEMSFARTYSLSTLKMYKYVKERFSVKLNSEILNFAETSKSLAGYKRLFDEGCNGHMPKPVHLLNYIRRERFAAGVSMISIRYLIDYWNALYSIYGEMVPSLLYPKNLRMAHDDMVARVKHKEDQELNERIIARSRASEKLCFADEELSLVIFPASDHQALINEGKTLRHCVAGYARKVASDNTMIFFIRKTSEPDIPYFTLEYKNKSVVQNRGFKNCDPPEEVVEFQKRWLDFIKQGEKYGKRSKSKQKLAADA